MKTRAGQKIRLTSVEELLGVANEESAMDLEIAKIRPFKDHPFKNAGSDGKHPDQRYPLSCSGPAYRE